MWRGIPPPRVRIGKDGGLRGYCLFDGWFMKDCRGTFAVAAAVRESRGVTLEKIARSTNININYLQAIERGEFEMLPGGIYNTSYIRQYAQAFDFDEQELLEAYHQTQAEDEGGPSDLRQSPRRRRSIWFARPRMTQESGS